MRNYGDMLGRKYRKRNRNFIKKYSMRALTDTKIIGRVAVSEESVKATSNYRLVGINAAGRRIGYDHQSRPSLTDKEVELVRSMYEKNGWKKSTRPPRSFPGWTYEKLALKFDVSKFHIRDIVKCNRRADYPVKFKKVRVKD